MSADLAWKALSVLWALISFWIGGVGLLVALTVTYGRKPSSRALGGWRRILFNLLLILSGIAGLALVFDPRDVLPQMLWGILALVLVIFTLMALYAMLWALTRSRSGQAFLEIWWPRLRIPARLILAGATLVGAGVADSASERAALLLLAGLQILLVIWELWLRWHLRDR